MFALLGAVPGNEDDEQPSCLDVLFSRVDRDKDGMISLEEFMRGVQRQPLLSLAFHQRYTNVA